jgi:paraquat-inducible protein B
MKENNESVVFKPKVEERKVSFAWVIPIIILCILAWIAYDTYTKKGTNIIVTFKSAEGLKEGVTPLEYKGLQLGKVTKITMHDDLKNVNVRILVKSDVAKYVASESSRFWIKKPTVSLTKISGLNTLISGYKIELSPKFRTQEEYNNGKEQLNFIGLDSKPDDELSAQGYYITLSASDKDNVEVGTPIFYNKFQIGEVVSKDFKYEKVLLNTYIYDKFNYLVNKSSKFVLNEALKVNYGPSGLQVEVGSLYSALVGGITVITPQKDEEKIKKDEEIALYADETSLEPKEYFNISFEEIEGIGEDTPILYKGIEIGKIDELTLNVDDVNVRAYVFEKYKYLLTNKTRFFIQEPEVSLSGVKNLGNIVKGNYLTLKYEKGEFTDSFTAFSKEKLNQNENDILITLYSDDLNSISKNSKVYYKNIEVGKVIDYGLTNSLRKVKIQIAIDKNYSHILNDHILFYDMSSKLVDLKALDLNINFSGIEPLLNGAIGIVGEKRTGKLKKKEFKLYSSYKDVEKLKRVYNSGFVINAYYNNDFEIKPNMAIIYKNQEIGFVKDIKFNDNKSEVQLFIYNAFKKYINSKSRFYKKGIVNLKASLNGVLFEVDNFTSLLEGSIHLDTNSNMIYDNYEIFSSFDDMKNSSNSITILFDDVEGVQKDFSSLTYKGVNIGKVTDVKLTSKHKVEVKAIIYDDYDSFAKEGTIFFLKKPRISLQEVANVGSTVMAVNIGVIKGEGKYKNQFVGYETQPSITKSHFGTIFKVYDSTASSVNVDAPVYYKNVQIGKVNKIDLSDDGSNVIVDCLIEDKYTKLIRKNSQFYDISGFELKFSLFSGTQVESNTFTSILKGGLVVVTPYEYNEKANSKDIFILNKTLREDWKTISPSIKD